MKYDKVFGLSMPQLLDIKHMLDVLDMELGDLCIYLEKDQVQLLAKQANEIKNLKNKLNNIKKECDK